MGLSVFSGDVFGSRDGVLAREMTKVHEEFLRGDLAHIRSILSERPSVKGECTLLVAGKKEGGRLSLQAVGQDIEECMETYGLRLSEAVRRVSTMHGLPKRRVYQEALRIQNLKKNGDAEQYNPSGNPTCLPEG